MADLLRSLASDLLAQSTSLVSAVAALVSVLATVAQLTAYRKRVREKLETAEKERFNTVLRSDDIASLGNYLDSTLGAFTVEEYSSSSKVADRVDQLLDKLQDFVAPSDEAIAPDDLNLESAEGAVSLDLPHPFSTFLSEVRRSETWNGLARLRRHTEQVLRDFARKRGIDEDELRSAGRIVRLLDQRKLIDPGDSKMLRYSIHVANQAIHGADVSLGQAEEAIWTAARVLPQYETQENR